MMNICWRGSVRIFLLVFSVLLYLSIQYSSSQEPFKNKITPDTLREQIIYEYDTIYLAPDTIKLTDTLIIKENKTVRAKAKSHFQFHLFDSAPSGRVPELPMLYSKINNLYLTIGISPFYMLPSTKTYGDSVKTKSLLNFEYHADLEYNKKNFTASFNIGYFRLTERVSVSKSRYINSVISNTAYDSLMITQTGTYYNYYNCLNLGMSIGRKFSSDDFYFVLSGTVSTTAILNSNAIEPLLNGQTVKTNSGSIQKINYFIGLRPYLGFKLRNNIDFIIRPYYNLNVFKNRLYPLLFKSQTGIETGLKFFL